MHSIFSNPISLLKLFRSARFFIVKTRSSFALVQRFGKIKSVSEQQTANTHISASFPSERQPVTQPFVWKTSAKERLRDERQTIDPCVFSYLTRGLILDFANINLVQRDGCTACIINSVQSTELLLTANTGTWNIVLDKEDKIQPSAAVHHNKSYKT